MNSLKTYHTQGTRKSINAILSDNKVLEKADNLPSSPTINIKVGDLLPCHDQHQNSLLDCAMCFSSFWVKLKFNYNYMIN
jgi:Zn-finger protein